MLTTYTHTHTLQRVLQNRKDVEIEGLETWRLGMLTLQGKFL